MKFEYDLWTDGKTISFEMTEHTSDVYNMLPYRDENGWEILESRGDTLILGEEKLIFLNFWQNTCCIEYDAETWNGALSVLKNFKDALEIVNNYGSTPDLYLFDSYLGFVLGRKTLNGKDWEYWNEAVSGWRSSAQNCWIKEYPAHIIKRFSTAYGKEVKIFDSQLELNREKNK